jgi:hypothetical protein
VILPRFRPASVDSPKGAKMREELFMARRKRRQFTPEFKAEAVRLTRVGDRSIGQVAVDLDLTETAPRMTIDGRLVGPIAPMLSDGPWPIRQHHGARDAESRSGCLLSGTLLASGSMARAQGFRR